MQELVSPKSNIRVPLITAPYTLTNSWAKVGNVINCKGINSIAVWLDISINTTTSLDFRFQGLTDPTDVGGYSFPTEEISVGMNKVYPRVFHIQKYDNQKLVVQTITADIIPYVQFEIISNANTGLAAVLETAYVTFQRIPRA